MGFLDKIFGRTSTSKDVEFQDPEIKALKNDLAREKNAMSRQRLQLDLQNSKLEAEIERIELQKRLEEAKADLEDLRAETRGSSGSSSSVEDMMLMKLFDRIPAQQPVMVTPGGQQFAQPAAAPGTTQFKHYTDEQLINFVKAIPAPMISQAKALNDDQLAEHIISRIPDIDDDSVDRMIAKIRGI